MGHQAIENHIITHMPLFYKAVVAPWGKVKYDAQVFRPHTNRGTLIPEFMGQGVCVCLCVCVCVLLPMRLPSFSLHSAYSVDSSPHSIYSAPYVLAYSSPYLVCVCTGHVRERTRSSLPQARGAALHEPGRVLLQDTITHSLTRPPARPMPPTQPMPMPPRMMRGLFAPIYQRLAPPACHLPPAGCGDMPYLANVRWHTLRRRPGRGKLYLRKYSSHCLRSCPNGRRGLPRAFVTVYFSSKRGLHCTALATILSM